MMPAAAREPEIQKRLVEKRWLTSCISYRKKRELAKRKRNRDFEMEVVQKRRRTLQEAYPAEGTPLGTEQEET